MINKTISSEVGIGIIAIVALVIGGIFWIEGKQMERTMQIPQKLIQSELRTRTTIDDLDAEEERVKKEAYEVAANNTMQFFVGKEIEDDALFREVKKKTGYEFFSDGFDQGNYFYTKEERDSVSKLRDKIMSGPIRELDLGVAKVYSAPNYFNISIDEFRKAVALYNDLGSPVALEASANRLVWASDLYCNTGYKPDEPDPEFWTKLYSCNFIVDAIHAKYIPRTEFINN